MKHALALINRYNMATYYLLPLIGLNKSSFGCDTNFINCFVDNEGTKLYVSVQTSRFGPLNHPGILEIKDEHPNALFVFYFPAKWKAHFELFKSGQYSKFCMNARRIINLGSDLAYNQSSKYGSVNTDLRLIAMDRDCAGWEIMRKRFSDYLDVEIAASAELLSAPDPSSFWCVPSAN